jgi:hypothetical protein
VILVDVLLANLVVFFYVALLNNECLLQFARDLIRNLHQVVRDSHEVVPLLVGPNHLIVHASEGGIFSNF